MYQVSHQMLSDKVNSQHKSHKDSAKEQQFLTPAEEQVVVDWCGQSSLSTNPLSATNLSSHAFAIKGKHPGKNWHYNFSKRHPEFVKAKPNGLDPKRAKNFNENVVHDYLEK